MVITNEDWDEVLQHVRQCRDTYVGMMGTPGVNVMFVLGQLDQLLKRHAAGERSEQLFKEMRDME